MKEKIVMANLEENPIKAQLRREKRAERLGDSHICVICGCTERTKLQVHHVAGRNHDPHLTVILCDTCHMRAHLRALDVGVSMHAAPTFLEALVATLRAIGSLLIMVGEALIEKAERCVRLVGGLDKDCPNWRQLPEAK